MSFRVTNTTIKMPQLLPVGVRPECKSLAEVRQAEANEAEVAKNNADYFKYTKLITRVSSYEDAVAKLDGSRQDWAGDTDGLVVLKDAKIWPALNGRDADCEIIDAEFQKNGNFAALVHTDGSTKKSYIHTSRPGWDKYECVSGRDVETIIVDNRVGTLTHFLDLAVPGCEDGVLQGLL